MKHLSYWALFTGLLLACSLSGQFHYQHLNQFRYLNQEAELYRLDREVHTSIRPLMRAEVDSGPTFTQVPNKGWWHRKWWHESLVQVEDPKYAIRIDPVVNLQLGGEMGEEDYRYINTRGYLLEGRIGQKFTFFSAFQENQARFADYIHHYAGQRRVVPGQSSGVRGFGTGGLDYTYIEGQISYQPNEFFAFTAGQGRNFFGEGYRSMLLSDGQFSYPFFRIETSFWKFRYVNLWAQMYDVRRAAQVSQGNYARKYLSSHYLSINITPRLNLAVFEAIVFGDTTQMEGLDVSFLNPIIFYRPVEFAVGSFNGNALLGGALSYKTFEKQQAYAQFVLDEFQLSSILAQEGSWVNKYAWQFGYKMYDAWGVKGLFQRLEYNAARPYTFSHREVLTNYAHYGSPLAHPWGANFHEFIFHTLWQGKRWGMSAQFNFGRTGADRRGENWGSDVYLPYETREQDLGNDFAQGVSGNYFFAQLGGSYLINPSSGLRFELGYRYRNFRPDEAISGNTTPMLNQESALFFLGLRTDLFNQYYDL